MLRAVVSVDGRDYSFARERIYYPHIGAHLLMPPAEARIVRADIRKKGQLIGYIPGAGDEIPQSLQQIGYNVKMLEVAEITAENLKRFDAVVLGIRAYNTQDRIANWQPELLAYVKAGGVVVAQYNTTVDLKTKQIGPFPLELSRDRVTDEIAEMRILAPDHPVLNSPTRSPLKISKGGCRSAGSIFRTNGTRPGRRFSPATIRERNRSMADCSWQNRATAISSTPVARGSGSCRRESLARIGFSPIWFPSGE